LFIGKLNHFRQSLQLKIPLSFRSSSRDQPPQLPPRDNIYGITTAGPPHNNVWAAGDKREKKKGGDDPYYFGLSARYFFNMNI
jgi:hypothetical protein